jgi:hypothetical protein
MSYDELVVALAPAVFSVLDNYGHLDIAQKKKKLDGTRRASHQT